MPEQSRTRIWAAPAGIISLLGLAAFIPFLRSLPLRLTVLMLLSAALFLGGAVGLQMVGGKIAEAESTEVFWYRVETNLEEALELAVVLIFIYGLLWYLDRRAETTAPDR